MSRKVYSRLRQTRSCHPRRLESHSSCSCLLTEGVAIVNYTADVQVELINSKKIWRLRVQQVVKQWGLFRCLMYRTRQKLKARARGLAGPKRLIVREQALRPQGSLTTNLSATFLAFTKVLLLPQILLRTLVFVYEHGRYVARERSDVDRCF